MLEEKVMIEVRKIAEEQWDHFMTTGIELPNTLTFVHSKSGIAICNPFIDETGRFDVDPVEYYGNDFLESDIVKVVHQKLFDEMMEHIIKNEMEFLCM